MRITNHIFSLAIISFIFSGCSSSHKLISNPQEFDHVILGYLQERQNMWMDQVGTLQIEIQQEIKGSILKTTMNNSPCPVNRQGQHISILDRKSVLTDFICVRYVTGYARKYEPQSFMFTLKDPSNECESEVILFFNADKIDSTMSRGDATFKCYFLNLFSNELVTNTEFKRIKSQALSRLR